jgi:hypothetical protein
MNITNYLPNKDSCSMDTSESINKTQIKNSVSVAVAPELKKTCKYCGHTVYFDERIRSKNHFRIPLNQDRSIHDHPFLIRLANATQCSEVEFESLCHIFDGSMYPIVSI